MRVWALVAEWSAALAWEYAMVGSNTALNVRRILHIRLEIRLLHFMSKNDVLTEILTLTSKI